jgi:hypothetical protein
LVLEVHWPWEVVVAAAALAAWLAEFPHPLWKRRTKSLGDTETSS